MDVSETEGENIIEKRVGDGGTSGRIYVDKIHTGKIAKIMIPAGSGVGYEIFEKPVLEGGILYVHKKHLGKTVKIIILEKKKRHRGG